MKQRITFFLGIFTLICVVLAGCSKDNGTTAPQIENINLNQSDITLNPGDSYTLTAETTPEDIEVTLIWSSSAPDIVSVDNSGTVTALALGEAVITVAADNGPSAECKVTVAEEESDVRSVTVTPSTGEILIGGTVTLTATVEPSDAEYTLTWSSSDESIATVNNDGTVTGIAKGNVVITADAGGVKGECRIAVVNTPVESITINQEDFELNELDTRTLTASVLPENADNKTITWTSSDESVAIVNGAGKVTALCAGETVITAKAGNMTDECRITVLALPLKVGDFYYSDGTWSSILDSEKECIGIVAYVGDITATDPVLAQEHPSCRHGLVVSLTESNNQMSGEGVAWQMYDTLYNRLVSDWILENADEYESIATGTEASDNINRPMGYNNTRAIEAFNADPANSQWPVDAVQWVVDYREAHPVPEHTSGWYLPSVKEMSLVMSGPYDGNLGDVTISTGISTENKTVINTSLSQISGSMLIGTFGTDEIVPIPISYWSSSEYADEHTYAFAIEHLAGSAQMAFKYDGTSMYRVRPVLAF